MAKKQTQAAEKAEKPVTASKGAATLDRDKKFYHVHSGGNVKFEQDGKLFNLEGNQVDLDGNPVESAVVEKEPEPEVVADAPAEPTPVDAEPAVDAEKTEGMTEDDLAALGGK